MNRSTARFSFSLLTAAVLGISALSAGCQPPAPPAEAPKAEFDARAWYEKYSKEVVEARNLDKAVSDYWTENVVYHNIDKTQGGAAVKAALTPYYDAFTDVKITIDDVIYQGNTVAARVTFEGKHTGKVGDIAPTGATVKQQITNWYVLKEGKISDIWSLADSAQVLAAIGAKAAPAPAAEASGSGAGSGSGAPAAPAAPAVEKK